jgi:pimeloyl-ACP methyl ester carboxylesterase
VVAGALHFIERGAGAPALVFLHHFGGSSRSWAPVIDRLGPAHRCIAPDLRGFGRSPPPPDGWTVDAAADDVLALVEAGGVRDYVLVGHSMGGKVALNLAARRPPGLGGLVLVAPSPPTPEPMAAEARKRLQRCHGNREAAEETVRRIVLRALTSEAFECCVSDQLASSPAAWAWWLERGSREDLSSRIGRLLLPTLVIASASDPVLPASVAQGEVMPRLAEARLATLDGAGHLMPLEAPGEVAELIGAFVRSMRAGSPARPA